MHTDAKEACGMQNFLLHGRTGADRNYDWLEYFDVVITGTCTRLQWQDSADILSNVVAFSHGTVGKWRASMVITWVDGSMHSSW